MNVTNWLEVEANVYSAGQPTDDKWEDIAAAGVRTVVNLRPLAEQQEDERPLVEAAGMTYVNLPVASLADINDELIDRIKQLREESYSGLLVHCASGNRVGALFAMAALAGGESLAGSMELGRNAGLTKLAPQVEMLLRQRQGR